MSEIRIKFTDAPGAFTALADLRTGKAEVKEAKDFAKPAPPVIGVVKVQVPTVGRADTPALVYNRDKSFHRFAEATAELRKELQQAHKGYFRCRVDGGELVLLARVGEQPW